MHVYSYFVLLFADLTYVRVIFWRLKTQKGAAEATPFD